jgi:hypothetical protein
VAAWSELRAGGLGRLVRLGGPGENDARDGGVVVEEAEVAPGGLAVFLCGLGGEEGAQGFALAEAELHGEQAFGLQG